MNIQYNDTKAFLPAALEDLFLSVEWESGKYPDKLAVAMKNSATVYSAWDGEKLVGLINALDDGIMTAYIHYLLVNPAYQGKGIGKQLVQSMKEKYKNYFRVVLISYNNQIDFYTHCGFEKSEVSSPMNITGGS
jgi:GNAT superfamily N-acetyltransferase